MARSKDVSVDTTQTNLIRAYNYTDQIFAGPIVAVVKPVLSKIGRWKTRGKEALDVDVSDEATDKAPTNEIGLDVKESTYYTHPKRLKGLVTDDEAEDFGQLAVETEMTLLLFHGINLRQEIRIFNLADGTTNEVTIATDWDTSTTVPEDVATNKNAFELEAGMPPTHLVIGEHIANEIAANANLRGLLADRDFSSTLRLLSNGRQLPDPFMGMRLVIPNVMFNAAKRGQARTIQRVWGDDAFMVRVDNATRSMTWAVQQEKLGPTVLRWRNNDPDGWYFKVMMKRDQNVTTPESIRQLIDVT